MNVSGKLRLGPLPKTETVKLTITMSATVKAELDRYAELHGRAHGESVDAATLVPHMLEAFMSRDRGFRKASHVTTNAARSSTQTKEAQ